MESPERPPPLKPPLKIVCLGDSLTTCGGEGGRYTDWLARWLPEHQFFNRGISGDTLEGGRARFQRDVLDLAPDIVVIELGANDYNRRRPIEAMEEDLEAMVSAARSQEIEVVIASCFGRDPYVRGQSRQLDGEPADLGDAIGRMEIRIADRYQAKYVPEMQRDLKVAGREHCWADRSHPNREGNCFVAARLLPALEDAVADRRRAKKP